MHDAPTGIPTLTIRLLGGFRVSVAGCDVPDQAWRGARTSEIVKLLALAPEHRLHREQVIEALWPELDSAAQTNNLNLTIYRVRRALSAATHDAARLVVRRGELVVLGDAVCVQTDVEAFQLAAAAAWHAQDVERLERAVRLYAGDLLPDDRYLEWLDGPRAALRASMLSLFARLALLYETDGDRWRAVQTWERLTTIEPTQEDAHVALMRLYAAVGQPRRALAHYDVLAAILQRELDAEPSAGTQRLRAVIAAQQYPADNCADDEPPQESRWAPLPIYVTPLLGREQEVAEICQLAERTRIITLIGAGGIGKTRLATAVAESLRGWFPDGVAFIDLAAIHAPSLVMSAIARATGISDVGDTPLVERVTQALQKRRGLLVIDNMEQVVDAAPQLAALVQQCPQLRIIVTSRVRLRVRGEVAYEVPVLDVPDPRDWHHDQAVASSPAIALFVQRATDIVPSYVMTPAEGCVVAEICHRLSGLPLAIELAAARSKVLSPHELLARLDQQLMVLDGGERDLPDRQRALRNTIAWSYDLLDSDAQVLLRRLSVFVDCWTLEAGEAVLSHDLGVPLLDTISRLVDSSLVIARRDPCGDTRFRILEPIREFAAERFQGEDDACTCVRRRHAHYYLHMLERIEPLLESAEQAYWLDVLEREVGNLGASLDWLRQHDDTDAALRLVRALKQFWFMRGRLVEGFEATLRVLALRSCVSYPDLHADALNAAGFLARELNDTRAEQLCLASLELSRELEDRQRTGDALANLGYLALQHARLDDAERYFHEVLATSRVLQNQQGAADALSFLGLVAMERADHSAARALNRESLQIWTLLHDRQGMVWAHTQLGHVALRQDDLSGAHAHFTAGLEIADTLGFRPGIAWAIDGLAQIALGRDVPELASQLVAVATSIRELAGNPRRGRESVAYDQLYERLVDCLGMEAVASIMAVHEHRDYHDVVQMAARELNTKSIRCMLDDPPTP